MTGKDDAAVWFEPKRFGYGAGLPVSWQGWLALIGYMAGAIAGGLWLAPMHPLLFGLLLIALTAAFAIVAHRHTRGGWRWRWDNEEG